MNRLQARNRAVPDYRRAGTIEDENGVQPVTCNQQPILWPAFSGAHTIIRYCGSAPSAGTEPQGFVSGPQACA